MKARDYKKEYLTYQGLPEQKKRRAGRNAARRMLAKQGLVRKGDGKDVHHKDHNPHNNARSNLAALSKSKNRGHLRSS